MVIFYHDDIHIGNQAIKSTKEAKILGVLFDNEMNITYHVNDICRKELYGIIFQQCETTWI